MKVIRPISKGFKVTAIVIASIILFSSIMSLIPIPKKYWNGDNPMRTYGDMPALIAHGGGNKEFPDNTLEAFYNAYSVDPNVMMETDVNITKDGVVILSHSTSMNRKTKESGAISSWNYTDMIEKEVDFGYVNTIEDGKVVASEHFKGADGKDKYPTDVEYPEGIEPRHETVFLATTLEELITAFPGNRISVEIKQSGEDGMRTLREVLRLLEEYDAFDRVVLASFHEEIYKEYQRLQREGEVPDAFMYSPAYVDSIAFVLLQAFGLDVFFYRELCVFQLPHAGYGVRLASRHLVRAIHDHNIAVQFWTVNDADDMEYLIRIGADGIMTDYPHLLKEVYDNYKK